MSHRCGAAASDRHSNSAIGRQHSVVPPLGSSCWLAAVPTPRPISPVMSTAAKGSAAAAAAGSVEDSDPRTQWLQERVMTAFKHVKVCRSLAWPRRSLMHAPLRAHNGAD